MKAPDIVFVVGNNGSLSQEIAAVEANINQNFAQIMEASGIDYRVVLVSRSGAHQFNICVEEPLGGVPTGQCIAQLNNAAPVQNAPRFYHYSLPIDSNDPWCKVLGSYDGTVPDEYAQAASGWSTYLRPDSFKVVVLVSDSSTNCLYQGTDLDDGPQSPSPNDVPGAEAAAQNFDDFLLGLSTADFGVAGARNYQFHTITGLSRKDPLDPNVPWLSTDPLNLTKCSSDTTSAVSPALGYQALSRLTGGLRFPICDYANFDVIFSALAQNIVASVGTIPCEYPLPDPGNGQTLDPATVEMKLTEPSEPTKTLQRIVDPAQCGPDRFYIENDTIVLCEEACAVVQAAGMDAKLDIAFGCELPPPPG